MHDLCSSAGTGVQCKGPFPCRAGPVTALACWQGVTLIAAAHADQTLTIHKPGLTEGALQYACVGKVDLPNVPTDLAALHLPVPSLAVGCEGR